MRIDMHTHFVPDAFRALLQEHGVLSGGHQIPSWSADAHLRFMDDHEIDVAVLSVSDPGATFGSRKLRRDAARIVNEAAAALVAEHGGRFRALATLPLPDADDAVAELVFALDELGLDGALIPTSVEGVYPGDERWGALFGELDRRGAHLLVQPTAPAHAPSLPLLPPWVLDFVFDSTRAGANLLFSGTLDRHPNVKVQLCHAGGTLPFVAHRMKTLEMRPGWEDAIEGGVLEGLKRLYFDTAIADNAAALGSLLTLVEDTHVLFGSDYPYTEEDLPPRGDPQPYLSQLGPDRRARIDCANALGLVPALDPEGRSAS